MDRDQKKYFLHKIVGYSFFFKQEKKPQNKNNKSIYMKRGNNFII